VSVDIWKCPSTQYGHDEVTLRATCIKNVKFKIIKITAGCQHVGYIHYSENLDWAAKKWCRGLDIAAVDGLDIT